MWPHTNDRASIPGEPTPLERPGIPTPAEYPAPPTAPETAPPPDPTTAPAAPVPPDPTTSPGTPDPPPAPFSEQRAPSWQSPSPPLRPDPPLSTVSGASLFTPPPAADVSPQLQKTEGSDDLPTAASAPASVSNDDAPLPVVPGSAQAIEHSGLAIASMVLGIVGLFTSVLLVGVLPSIAAVIAGHFAQRRSPDSRAFWLTGLITGYVGIGAAVLFLLVFAVPFMLWVFANGQNSYLFNR